MKAFFLLLFIAILGTFIYLKLEVNGDPNSHFNQTTRYSLGKYSFMRAILGLHSVGDARAEYFAGNGDIVIEWFKSQTEDFDPSAILVQFANLVSTYTGRQADVIFGGGLDDGTITISNLNAFQLKTSAQTPAGSTLAVYFTSDYSPRGDNELSTTYNESSIVISLDAHRNFLQTYRQDLSYYVLASLLHEFGNQIGLPENPSTSADPTCIMNLHTGINGKPLEYYGDNEPQNFCPSEIAQINALKAMYAP